MSALPRIAGGRAHDAAYASLPKTVNSLTKEKGLEGAKAHARQVISNKEADGERGSAGHMFWKQVLSALEGKKPGAQDAGRGVGDWYQVTLRSARGDTKVINVNAWSEAEAKERAWSQTGKISMSAGWKTASIVKKGSSQEMMGAKDAGELVRFEARIWEKAEHWSFDTTVDAKDEADARKKLLRDYPRSEYTIQEVRKA